MSQPGPTPCPFTIHIPEEVLVDLRQRLNRVRWPDEIPDSNWQYGTSLGYMQEFVTYWRDVYDWRKHEALLNSFKQFTVSLAGVGLGISQAHSAPHRSRAFWGRSGRRIHRRCPLAPRLWILLSAESAALRCARAL